MRLLEQIVDLWNIISSEKNAIFKQLADLFNLSFMTGVFLSVIDDLNQAIKFCKVHPFPDDTNLLCESNSIKKLNKLVNTHLKHPVNWCNAYEISLTVKKLKW